MTKRSSFDIMVGAIAIVLILAWLALARMIWIAQPSMSANLNPTLPIHCSSEMLFDCTVEAERTFWNYNTDFEGLEYTHGWAAVIIVACVFLAACSAFVNTILMERIAQKFFFTNPWLIYKIRNRPVAEPYVADDPQHEVTKPRRP